MLGMESFHGEACSNIVKTKLGACIPVTTASIFTHSNSLLLAYGDDLAHNLPHIQTPNPLKPYDPTYL